MCWCVGRQTANMAEKGVTASSYGTEYACQYQFNINIIFAAFILFCFVSCCSNQGLK